MAWKHPTGKTPKSVCLVCLGPSKHSLLEMTTNHQPDPNLMAVDEVWGLNGGVNHFCGRVQYDLLWVLDFLQGEEAKEPTYVGYIRRYLDRFRGTHLITTEADESWPLARVHEYPFAEIAALITKIGGKDCVWFRNSVPMIAVYAWYIGVEQLFIFGADYHHEALKNREDDKGNAEAWLHFCRMMGMRIISSTDTTVLDFNKPQWIYGYQRQPKYDASTNTWIVAPPRRPTLTGVSTDGGVSADPSLVPPQVREMITRLDQLDEERLVELTAKVEAVRQARAGG